MKQQAQELLEKFGKHSTVTFEGKSRHKKFDENFGKQKIDTINIALCDKKTKRRT